MNDCYIKDICMNCNTTNCNNDCYTKNYYKRVLNKSNIPAKYIHANQIKLVPNNEYDLKQFRKLAAIRNDIQNFVKEGKSLYIYSPYCGNGKTTWAIKLAIEYLHTLETPRTLPVKFVNTQSMIADWKNRFNDDLDTTPLFHLIQDLKECDLAIFDDIGITTLTESDISLLFSIIDYRLTNNKSCIFTSNNVPSMLPSKVGVRLGDRINKYSKCIGFKQEVSGREVI